MMIARTQGIPLTAVAASEVEGTSNDDNWQNILVKGVSSIRTPADLAGKTIAVNALKGVGEVMIKRGAEEARRRPELRQAARAAVPGDALGPQQRPGRRGLDARAVPLADPGDGGRTVMAPGPELGRFWPIGGYGALNEWIAEQPGLAAKFRRRSTSRSRTRRRTRTRSATCCRRPRGTSGCRSGARSSTATSSSSSRSYTKQYGVISNLPNLAAMVPSTVAGGKNLQGTVGNRFILLRQDG